MQQFLLKFLSAVLLFGTGNWVFAQQGVIRVACIGNSVTYGYVLKDAGEQSYPALLQQHLGERYEVRNFGNSGATLLKKGHNPYFKTKAFADAIAFEPDVAILHLGLNDTDPRNWPNYNSEFESDYSWLLDTFKKINPSIKLYICKLTPIFSGHPRFKSGTRDWYDEIQQIIPQIAKANNTGLIDLNAALFNRPDLFDDNLHPGKEGAAIIAQTVYQTLSKNFGGLKLATVFTNNMVLQRKQPIPVYGTANAGDKVEVIFKEQRQTTTANEAGKWKVIFPAMAHGGPYDLKVQTSDSTIELSNILVGDVWLCSGQSNMDFQLRNAKTGEAELSTSATNPLIRLYKLNNLAQTNNANWDSITLVRTNRLDFFSAKWEECNAATAAGFSAVGYYFGKKIASELAVPIGLIQVSVGGASTESFIDRYTMEHDNLLVDMMHDWRKSDFIMPWSRERAAMNLKNAVKAKQRHPYEPSYNYEAGIAPLTLFPIKGVAWYQGESNAHNIALHEHLFKTLVKSWRERWGQEFPFYYAQLSSIDRPSWPQFRDSQRRLLREIRNSGMAVTSDLGDSLDVHPKKKKEVGERLALQALRNTYKKPIVADGPVIAGVRKEGNTLVVSFTSASLLYTSTGQELTGFELENEKGMRFKAKAAIQKNSVIITIPQGEKIKAILYAWQPFTRANLVNQAALPASTFSISLKQ